ncbi:CinA family protein [Stappia sp. ES.058]|uniref:CinA family protein n=1 Tax=Stappia sp. ES.058 TaxID=1881061 RepID=UPI00087D4A2C|nr:CinA family protein [Stappia sp. ES.058]SDU10442.1 nicotinamide-nucleotide amidase [Stappia sp. ES.058]
MTDLTSLMPAAVSLVSEFTRTGRMVATAESCTGGLIAAVLTEVPGSSAVVERGFVTYSNEAKTELLAVPEELIADKGAVSREVAMAMASGALAASRADVTVAVTGIAGPGGGSPEKPVGLVHFGFAAKGKPASHEEHRFGDLSRAEIRLATVAVALAGLSKLND